MIDIVGIIFISLVIATGFVLAERARKFDYERGATRCSTVPMLKQEVRYSSDAAKCFAQDCISHHLMELIRDPRVSPDVVIVGVGKAREVISIK